MWFFFFCLFVSSFLFHEELLIFPASKDKFGVILYLDIFLTAVDYESSLVAQAGTLPRTNYSLLQFIAVSALGWSKTPLTDILTKQ